MRLVRLAHVNVFAATVISDVFTEQINDDEMMNVTCPQVIIRADQIIRQRVRHADANLRTTARSTATELQCMGGRHVRTQDPQII